MSKQHHCSSQRLITKKKFLLYINSYYYMVLLLINPIICLIEYIISHTNTQQSCSFFFRKITKIIGNIFNVHHEPDNNSEYKIIKY